MVGTTVSMWRSHAQRNNNDVSLTNCVTDCVCVLGGGKEGVLRLADFPVHCTPSQVATANPSAEYVSQIKRRVEDDTTARKVRLFRL